MCTSANLLLYPNRSIGRILCDVIGYALKTRRATGISLRTRARSFYRLMLSPLSSLLGLQFHYGERVPVDCLRPSEDPRQEAFFLQFNNETIDDVIFDLHILRLWPGLL
jgi:hypothetical protein